MRVVLWTDAANVALRQTSVWRLRGLRARSYLIRQRVTFERQATNPNDTFAVQCPRILVVSGASGVGKTTLVRIVEARGIPGVWFHYFDAIGVPTPDQMSTEFGDPANWQLAMTNRWIERLATANGLSVLDGQIRPSTVRAACRQFHVDGHILLIDCSHAVREARLRDSRRQPELNTRDMACWASYLRGQADALDLPVLDTTDLSIEAGADWLQAHISALAAL